MQKNILIVGGTGHIGTLINRILKERNPSFQSFNIHNFNIPDLLILLK